MLPKQKLKKTHYRQSILIPKMNSYILNNKSGKSSIKMRYTKNYSV
jgi:ribosomal protein S19